jgi:signal transduction histidine kinase
MSTAAPLAPAPLAPAAWLRLPRRTARLRLTLLYSGLFLLSGTCVLAGVYLLVAHGPPIAVHTSRAAPLSAQPHPAAGGGSITVLPVPVAHRDIGVQVRDGVVAQRAADLGRLLGVSWLVLAISAVASAILGWFAAGRVLRPLRAITTTARTISAGNLHERLALTGPNDEFKQLGDTLDALLGRLQASFEAQKRFVANASHELRTPLTVERTLLQVALADPSTSVRDFRSMCEELLVLGDEHERLLEALLTLAGSDRGLDRREPFDLATVSDRVLQAARAKLERRGLKLHVALEPAPATGDPALAERLVANLIDNATEHNLEGGYVDVRTERDEAQTQLTVANSGEPIAPEEIDRLFEPFQRLDTSRSVNGSGHFGLGLSIVRAIAVAHGATVTARPGPEGGLSITVRFPR